MATISTPTPEAAGPVVLPWTIAKDNREERAGYNFDGLVVPERSSRHFGKRIVVPVNVQYLETGDYSIVGFEKRICVERKAMNDLFATVTVGRVNFIEELGRMLLFDEAHVVVEASWEQILQPEKFNPSWQSGVSPLSVWRSVQAWTSYRSPYAKIHWWAMDTKRLAEIKTFEILKCYWEGEQRR